LNSKHICDFLAAMQHSRQYQDWIPKYQVPVLLRVLVVVLGILVDYKVIDSLNDQSNSPYMSPPETKFGNKPSAIFSSSILLVPVPFRLRKQPSQATWLYDNKDGKNETTED